MKFCVNIIIHNFCGTKWNGARPAALGEEEMSWNVIVVGDNKRSLSLDEHQYSKQRANYHKNLKTAEIAIKENGRKKVFSILLGHHANVLSLKLRNGKMKV